MFLKLENFFSHKESEIDFSLFNSALLLGSTDGDYFRSNGSGKSAIMESILWCLYNKSRAAMMDDVIHWGENRCSVIFDFLHDKKTYRVKRTRMRNTSTSTVDFYIQNSDSTWSPLSGSTSGETNEKIISTIKLDHKTFVNSAYFRQNDISEFATSEASKKKEILKSIVDISKWDGYEKEAKKKQKDIQLEVLQVQTRVNSLTEETASFQSSVETLSNIEQEFSLLSEKKESLDGKIEVLSDQYIKLKSSINTDGWDKSVAEIASLKQLGK
jgi:exonuclease SbcC